MINCENNSVSTDKNDSLNEESININENYSHSVYENVSFTEDEKDLDLSLDSSIDSSENVFCESSENKQENVKKVNNYFNFDTKKLVGVAMFAAFAYAVTFVFRLPVSFLTFDAKDSVITLASLIFGPVSGVAISLIVASIEFISIGSHGLYGFIMDFASSAVFSFVAGLVYKIKRNATGAVLSFYSASLVMVSVMVVLNIIMAVLQDLAGTETTGSFQQCFQLFQRFIRGSLFFCKAICVQADQHRPLLHLFFKIHFHSI